MIPESIPEVLPASMPMNCLFVKGMQSRGMQSRGMQSRGMQSRGMQLRTAPQSLVRLPAASVLVEARDNSDTGVESYRRLLEAAATWTHSNVQLLEELDHLPIKDGEHT